MLPEKGRDAAIGYCLGSYPAEMLADRLRVV
jgi:hypothetical protein